MRAFCRCDRRQMMVIKGSMCAGGRLEPQLPHTRCRISPGLFPSSLSMISRKRNRDLNPPRRSWRPALADLPIGRRLSQHRALYICVALCLRTDMQRCQTRVIVSAEALDLHKKRSREKPLARRSFKHGVCIKKKRKRAKEFACARVSLGADKQTFGRVRGSVAGSYYNGILTCHETCSETISLVNINDILTCTKPLFSHSSDHSNSWHLRHQVPSVIIRFWRWTERLCFFSFTCSLRDLKSSKRKKASQTVACIHPAICPESTG